MYPHILLAVALQQWDEFSPHAVAAREAAVALAHGSGAQLSVLSVYDYNDETPDAISLPPEEVARYRDTQMVRMDERMATKMQAFLAGIPTHETSITPLLKVGDPRQLIVATAEALGVDCLVIGAHSKRSFLDEAPTRADERSGATAANHHPRGISLMESGKPSVVQVAPLDNKAPARLYTN